MVNNLFRKISNRLLKDPLRIKQTNIRNLIANVTIPLALLLVLNAASVQASLRGQDATNGSKLRTFQARPTVPGTNTQTTRMTFVRNGRLQTMSVTVPSSGRSMNPSRATNTGRSSWINPDLMVVTSQGVMHRSRAERLGLPYTLFIGSRE